MDHVIDLLEKLGQKADLRYATSDKVERVLEEERVDLRVRAAVLAGDQRQLQALLGARTNVCCMVHAPKTGEDEEEKTRKAKEDDKEKVASGRAAAA